jgi:hypothetical protein
LMEADLMRRVLPSARFAAWLTDFLPGVMAQAPASLFRPVVVDDRADPLLVHLDGLNLSRAWCLTGIADALPRDDARREPLGQSAERHRAAGLAGLASGDYAGEHWLGTFAALALTAGVPACDERLARC